MSNNPQPLLFRYTLIVRDLPNLTYVLPMAPSGWEENQVNWNRDTKTFGLTRSFTTQLKFVTESAAIIRNEFYTYGLFANVKIKIEKRNKQWTYDQVFYGQLDFSNVTDQQDYFLANAINLGIEGNIAAYSDTTFEIPLDSDAVEVDLPALRLFESAQLLLAPSQSNAQPGFPEITVITNEVNASQASVQAQGYFHSFSPNFATLPNWFFQANTNTSLNIKLDQFTGAVIAGIGTHHMQIQFVKSDGTVLHNIVDITTAGAQTFNVTNSYDFNLLTGEKVFIYMRCDSDISAFHINSGTMQLSYFTSTPSTKCKAFKALDLFRKIITKVNQDVPYPIQSFYLQDIDGLLLTCGDFIRNITTKTVIKDEVIGGEDVTTIIVQPYTQVLKTSLNDFFQSIRAVAKNSQYGVGMGYESGKVIFEDLTYWFKPIEICYIKNIADIEITPYIEYIFNNLKAGYPDQTYNSQLNGRYEINSSQEYTSPIKQIGDSNKTLDLTSVYRADPYGIEEIRVLETDTTNDYSDNDVFFLDCAGGGTTYGLITGQNFTNITGTLAGITLYNLNITPKRNLLRNGGFLRSALNADGYQIKFASGLKNYTVSSVNPGGIFVDEHANIDIQSLPAPIFYPLQVTITTDYPKNTLQLLDSMVGGYISFDYRGQKFSGYPIDVSIDIAENTSQQFKLLLLPNQKLGALVHPLPKPPVVIVPPPPTIDANQVVVNNFSTIDLPWNYDLSPSEPKTGVISVGGSYRTEFTNKSPAKNIVFTGFSSQILNVYSNGIFIKQAQLTNTFNFEQDPNGDITYDIYNWPF